MKEESFTVTKEILNKGMKQHYIEMQFSLDIDFMNNCVSH